MTVSTGVEVRPIVPKPRDREPLVEEDLVIRTGALAIQAPEQTDQATDEATLGASVLGLDDLINRPDVDSDASDEKTDEDEARDLAETGTANTPPIAVDKAKISDAEREVWDLVERARGGDAEAFAQIYLRYRDEVERYAYFRTGNRQIAEDLTSEVFIRALRRIGSVTWQGRDLGAWLITIARNLTADHYKSGRTRFEVFTEDPVGTEIASRDQEADPEAAALGYISNVELLQVVQKLPPGQQKCVIFRFLMGYSVAETAEELGINEGATKALQYRAVRALKKLLPEGFEL